MLEDEEAVPRFTPLPRTSDCVHVTLVGLSHVGKTCASIKFTTGSFPAEYVPTVFDTTMWHYSVDEKPIVLYWLDTAGGERFDRLRPLYYVGSNVMVFCVSPHMYSFKEIEEVFLYETNHHCPDVPKVLIMLSADKRDGLEPGFKTRYDGWYGETNQGHLPIVDTKLAIEYAQKWKVSGYAECSAKFDIGVSEAFRMAIRLGIQHKKEKLAKENSSKLGDAKSKLLSFVKQSFKRQPSISKEDQKFAVRCIGDMPVSVYGHSTAVMNYTIYLFGGQERGDKIFSCNIESGEWTAHKSVFPASLKFHSCVTTGSDNFIYLFGGKGNGYSNELLRFDIKDLSEPFKIQVAGAPSPRYGQTAVYYKGQIFIFGGYDSSGMACNDFYSFTIGTLTWNQIKTKSKPPSDRFMHSAVVYNNAMYIYGGMNSNSKPLKDFFKFDFDTTSWEKMSKNGLVPTARYGHSATVVGNSMYIFGGCGKVHENTVYSNEFFEYDFKSRLWSLSDYVKQHISERNYLSLVSTVGGLFLLGGKLSNGLESNDFFNLYLLTEFYILKLQLISRRLYDIVNSEDIAKRYLDKHHKYHEHSIKMMIENGIIPQPATPLTNRQIITILNSPDYLYLSVPPPIYPPSITPIYPP